MSDIIKFKSNFGVILIETSSNSENKARKFGAGKKAIEEAEASFEDSLGVLESISATVVERINNVSQAAKPDHIEIKMGLKFSAEAGAFIAKTSAEGNLEVVVKWSAPKNVDEK